MAGWVVAGVLLLNEEPGSAWIGVAALLGVAIGAGTNRWWVVGIPAAGFAVLLVAWMVDGPGTGEISAVGELILTGMFVVGFQVPLAAGVGVRRLWIRRELVRPSAR